MCEERGECTRPTCVICLDIIAVEKDRVCVSECTHSYHEKCIQRWLRQPQIDGVRRCPTCRREMIGYVLFDGQAEPRAWVVTVADDLTLAERFIDTNIIALKWTTIITLWFAAFCVAFWSLRAMLVALDSQRK